VAVGAHTPWPPQLPLLCHEPAALHVCVSVPQLPHATGFVWPGAQEPVHDAVPLLATHVLLVHVVVSTVNCPRASHDVTLFVVQFS
jgi:hypothetical protein